MMDEGLFYLFFLPVFLLVAGYLLGMHLHRPEPTLFNENDIAVVSSIIQRTFPKELRLEYLYDFDGWWFVEWSKKKKEYRVTALYLNGGELKGELDVSGLTGLIRLDCQDNQLTSLKLSRLPNLTTLNCYNNQLTSLDLSGLPNLTYLNSANNREIAVTLPRGRSSLTCLYCSDNEPPVMVLPKWFKVRTFYLQDNPIKVIDTPWKTRLVPLAPSEPSMEEYEEPNEIIDGAK